MTGRRARTAVLVLCAAVLAGGGAARAGDMAEITAVSASEVDLAAPAGIAINQAGTYLYVADTGNREIKVLDPGNLRLLGAFGANALSAPIDVAFAPDGRVLVLERDSGAVLVFDVRIYRHETVVKSFEEAADAALPDRLSATADSGRRAVVDPAAGAVTVVDAAGTVLARITGGAEAPLAGPEGVEMAGRYVWVADTRNHRVRLFRLGGLN